jgi:hypothetical protein
VLRTSVFRYRSHLLFSSRAKRSSIHPDPMVTLCPDRAKKLHPSRASHLALQHCRGGCPVPRAASLSQRRFVSHTLTCIQTCTITSTSFWLFIHLQTIKPQHFAIVVLSRILIECSPAAASLRFPAIQDPGFFLFGTRG